MRKPKRASNTVPDNIVPETEFGSVPPSSGKGPSQVREVDAQALLHELRVHQFELEMQNEELRRARSEMELALRRYTEIFDFSPLGYATLQADDAISDVNLAGSQILGLPRAVLSSMRFELLISSTHRIAFGELISAARSSGEQQTSDLELLCGGGRLLTARLSAIPLMRSEPTLLLAFEELRPLEHSRLARKL